MKLEAAAAPHDFTVLVIDDDRRQREATVRLLTSFGTATTQASSGYAGLRCAAEQRPPLIVVDALLPELHGFELARLIRRIDDAYAPEIVVLTGVYKNVRYINEAILKYGIDAYLTKPVDRVALGQIVQRAKRRVKCLTSAVAS